MTPDHLRRLSELATPGPWMIQDGCSWRRIGTHMHDGDVLCPTNARDGHPDLTAADGRLRANLELIVEMRNSLPHLLARITALEAEREGLREAAERVLSFRNGDLPSRGWLADNDGSRRALADLAEALTRQPTSAVVGEAALAIIDAQTMRDGFYSGWNITALNKAAEQLRAALGMEPTPLSPETLRMIEHARKNRGTLFPQPTPAKGAEGE